MENIFPRCAGLDVHKETVEAHVRHLGPDDQLHQQTRRCGTMTWEIPAMSDWLASQYRRLAGRRGKKRALVAVRHSILVIVYYMSKARNQLRRVGRRLL